MYYGPVMCKIRGIQSHHFINIGTLELIEIHWILSSLKYVECWIFIFKSSIGCWSIFIYCSLVKSSQGIEQHVNTKEKYNKSKINQWKQCKIAKSTTCHSHLCPLYFHHGKGEIHSLLQIWLCSTMAWVANRVPMGTMIPMRSSIITRKNSELTLAALLVMVRWLPFHLLKSR